MKRLLAVLFCLFVSTFSSAYATDTTEVPAFDKTVFEASSLYSYDKFDKTWTVQAHWEKKYSDATFEFHVVLFDSDLAEYQSPELIVEFFNKDYQAYDEVTAFRMLIGEKLYTFEKMDHFRETAGSVYGGNVLRNMLNALSSSDEVAIQIDVTDILAPLIFLAVSWGSVGLNAVVGVQAFYFTENLRLSTRFM